MCTPKRSRPLRRSARGTDRGWPAHAAPSRALIWRRRAAGRRLCAAMRRRPCCSSLLAPALPQTHCDTHSARPRSALAAPAWLSAWVPTRAVRQSCVHTRLPCCECPGHMTAPAAPRPSARRRQGRKNRARGTPIAKRAARGNKTSSNFIAIAIAIDCMRMAKLTHWPALALPLKNVLRS